MSQEKKNKAFIIRKSNTTSTAGFTLSQHAHTEWRNTTIVEGHMVLNLGLSDDLIGGQQVLWCSVEKKL